MDELELEPEFDVVELDVALLDVAAFEEVELLPTDELPSALDDMPCEEVVGFDSSTVLSDSSPPPKLSVVSPFCEEGLSGS